MLLHNKHTVLISPADSKLIYSLNSININCIFSEEITEIIEFEKFHADMQLLSINNIGYIPNNSKNLYDKIKPFFKNIVICKELQKNYPDNIILNAALIDNKLFCKANSLAIEVTEYCNNNGIEIINVNQGYSKCSTLILKNAIITSDLSIKKAADKKGVEALLIQPGFIRLEGAEYGFIGGASGVIGNTVYFFGNIKKHPDYCRIIEFIEGKGMSYISLTEDELHDVGGFVQLN